MKKYSLTFSFILFLVSFTVGQNNPPTAVNDTANTYRGYVKMDVLDNDFDIDSNNIRVFNIVAPNAKHGLAKKINDSIIEYTSFPSFTGGIDSFAYRIIDDGSPFKFDTAKVYLYVDNSFTFDTVDINNINAGFNANGDLFWWHMDNITYPGPYDYYANKFEVPKGSGKQTIFNGNLWIGGIDNIDTLHVAAQMYNQIGRDFWAGPVSNVYDSLYDAKWNRIWKIKKSDIDYHLANCWQPGYIPFQSLIDWPGNGNTALGQTAITAPFKDWNNDGIYNPYGGDYPLIKGDEAVYFIFNDDRYLHSESQGNKLKIEVQGMAYSFDCIADSALWNSIFINYKIYNRSSLTYDSAFIGTFIDFDLGDASDDYMGCDVQRGSFYCYNGDNVDGNGQPNAYGAHPPAQAAVYLSGAKMDPDGIDNPSGLCDAGINGFNFGNGIIDDEHFGLNRFVYFFNYIGIQGTPEIAIDYYNYLKGFWKDSTKMLYGGNAHAGAGAYGPECNFMFPGNSDTCNWGTGGHSPNGPVYWTEVTAGNTPADRRGLGSTGPFTFKPGDVQELDIAFVFGRDYNDSNATAAIIVMNQRIDSIRKYFMNDSTPCGGGFSGIVKQTQNLPQLKIYPNPANDYITVEFNTIAGNINYEIFDIVGRRVSS
ncbi:MAG: Ig-like domain-containing protein, partial [Bacteroidales bacterium]